MRPVTAPVLIALILLSAAPAEPPSSDPPAAPPAPPRATPAPSIEKVPPEHPPPESAPLSDMPGITAIKNPAFPLIPVLPEPSRGRPFSASDLDPYFSAGRAREAKLEFDKGHFAAARALLLREGQALPVRYLRALSALRAEAFSTAAQEMAALSQDYLVLRDRCLLHAATAYEQLRQWEPAADFYAKVEPDSRLYPDARLGLVRVLHRGGRLQTATEVATELAAKAGSLPHRDVAAEALRAAADLLREAKDWARERETLIRLWSSHPLSPLSSGAGKRLGSKLPLEASVTRAERLIDSHRNHQGIDLLQPLLHQLSPPDPLGCRAYLAYGKAWRKLRKHGKAVAALLPVAEHCNEPELLARARFVLGSSLSLIDPERAAESYESMARDFPDHAFADDALFYAADLHLKAGESEVALKRLEELAEKYPAGDFFAEALFRSAWIHREQKRTDLQLRLLNELEVRFANSDAYEVQRAKYWRARALESLGQPAQAVKLLSTLSENHPTGYYGLMARLRLEKLDVHAYSQLTPRLAAPARAADPWPFYPGPMAQDSHFQSGVELLRLGSPDLAIPELLAVNRSGQSPQALQLLVHLLTLAGDVRAAHSVARTSLRAELSGQITAQNLSLWERAYPLPFRGFTERHCGEEKMDPDLLQALMREESALDPRAQSPAGALGLTQLMLPTAQVVARSLRMPRVTSESLLHPDPSIKLGAHYLASLLRQFKGNVAHALAAYNAGPLAVKRWKAALPDAELDEWVEEIPISETRGYVKRVLRTYNTYRLLYGREAWSEPPLLSRLLSP